MNKELIVCRCEEVTWQDISSALQAGAKTAKAVKLKTRAGMGICQGRTCKPMLEKITAEEMTAAIPERSSLTHHYPVRPLMLGELMDEKRDED